MAQSGRPVSNRQQSAWKAKLGFRRLALKASDRSILASSRVFSSCRIWRRFDAFCGSTTTFADMAGISTPGIAPAVDTGESNRLRSPRKRPVRLPEPQSPFDWGHERTPRYSGGHQRTRNPGQLPTNAPRTLDEIERARKRPLKATLGWCVADRAAQRAGRAVRVAGARTAGDPGVRADVA